MMSAWGSRMMGGSRLTVLGGLLACASWVEAAPPGQPTTSSNAYTCIDASGRKLTSDRLIAACMDREQREISATGTVRIIPPRATAKELQAQEETRRVELEKVRAAQRERAAERALLSRYPNRPTFDAARVEALKLPTDAVQAAEQRIAGLMADRKKLDQEMEFYVKDPSRAPAELRRKFDINDSALEAQRLSIANQKAEATRINARFDQDLTKLQQLWR
ncbi:DUF4124 domain-containing protein [Comamonas serinivorans]|nr:DUF4124 domain-containing protein [Comamonas serinivorans]